MRSRRFWLLPALVNAHDHGRAIRSSSIGAAGKPLEAWLHYLALFPSVDPYAASVVALSRSALGGVGTVMMHYTRAQGFTDLPTEVKEVARAAKDVGVRVGFAVSMKDRNPLVYGPSEPVLAALPENAADRDRKEIPAQAIIACGIYRARGCRRRCGREPDFDVQYGPNGRQWCSDALLEAVAEASQRTGRRVHMHLLETRYQRGFMDQAYPERRGEASRPIGLLSPRLTLAHCVWARPDELELLAERGVTIVVSNSSNLHLRSGIAPIPLMLEKAAGSRSVSTARRWTRTTTGCANCGSRIFCMPAPVSRSAASREQMLKIAFANGRFSVTNKDDGGAIKPGAPADLLLLDWARDR